MKLVDADALKTELMLAAETLTVAYEAHGEGRVVHSEDIIKCDKMNELLRNFPTIDAVPVVQGKWIYEGARGRFPACRCSVCGNVENADWAMISGEVNYCPNCGTKMVKGEGDETD